MTKPRSKTMTKPLASSFRDPSGFLFTHNNTLYRQVNRSYQNDYDLLMSSGLYDALTKNNLLIPHHEVTDVTPLNPDLAYKIIAPDPIHFISYPYEWSFSQFKDAALLTLNIHKRAIQTGLALKDASAYNVQFHNAKPTFIDTLSFEKYTEGEPWVAYKQFCQHFLAPLALMSKTDVRCGLMMRQFIDGIPLDLAAKLLPASTKFKPAFLMHIHMNAKAQAKHAGGQSDVTTKPRPVSKIAMLGIIDSLKSTIQKLTWKPAGTEWGDYYDNTNYTDDAFLNKKTIIESYLDHAQPKSVWDLGANTGVFTRLASERNLHAVSFDIDPAAVEQNYRRIKAEKTTGPLPLVMDLTNPSPALGWAHDERMAMSQRGNPDMIFALALIHHLAISNNLPLTKLADFFADLAPWLIIEFVPKQDSQVKILLATREDVFPDYTPEGFEDAFTNRFTIEQANSVENSERTLFLLKRK